MGRVRVVETRAAARLIRATPQISLRNYSARAERLPFRLLVAGVAKTFRQGFHYLRCLALGRIRDKVLGLKTGSCALVVSGSHSTAGATNNILPSVFFMLSSPKDSSDSSPPLMTVHFFTKCLLQIPAPDDIQPLLLIA